MFPLLPVMLLSRALPVPSISLQMEARRGEQVLAALADERELARYIEDARRFGAILGMADRDVEAAPRSRSGRFERYASDVTTPSTPGTDGEAPVRAPSRQAGEGSGADKSAAAAFVPAAEAPAEAPAPRRDSRSTCRIWLRPGYATGQYEARRESDSEVIARSALFRFGVDETIDESPVARRALERLLARLEHDGWEIAPHGEESRA